MHFDVQIVSCKVPPMRKCITNTGVVSYDELCLECCKVIIKNKIKTIYNIFKNFYNFLHSSIDISNNQY